VFGLSSASPKVTPPSELDSAEDRAAALQSPDGDPATYSGPNSWGDFLARDVKLLADGGIDGIVVLPGWERSKGARLETFVGRMLCNVKVFTWDATYEELRPVSMLRLANAWLGVTLSFHRIHPFEEAA